MRRKCRNVWFRTTCAKALMLRRPIPLHWLPVYEKESERNLWADEHRWRLGEQLCSSATDFHAQVDLSRTWGLAVLLERSVNGHDFPCLVAPFATDGTTVHLTAAHIDVAASKGLYNLKDPSCPPVVLPYYYALYFVHLASASFGCAMSFSDKLRSVRSMHKVHDVLQICEQAFRFHQDYMECEVNFQFYRSRCQDGSVMPVDNLGEGLMLQKTHKWGELVKGAKELKSVWRTLGSTTVVCCARSIYKGATGIARIWPAYKDHPEFAEIAGRLFADPRWQRFAVAAVWRPAKGRPKVCGVISLRVVPHLPFRRHAWRGPALFATLLVAKMPNLVFRPCRLSAKYTWWLEAFLPPPPDPPLLQRAKDRFWKSGPLRVHLQYAAAAAPV
jgi:hypothetical protein